MRPCPNEVPRPEKSNSNHVNNREKGQILNFRRKMEEKFFREGFFSKHFGLIRLAGLRVLKHFWEKCFTSFHLDLCSFSLDLVFHLLSSLCRASFSVSGVT